MTTTARPLAKALHTVTVVARVAALAPAAATSPQTRALWALSTLGYTLAQIDTDGELFAACVKAVRA